MAKTFEGPPTLERSGSEHRRAVTSFLLRRKAWLEVELSLQERRRGRKNSFFKGKEGRGDFRKDIPHQPQGDRSSYFLFFILQKKCQVRNKGSLNASAG